ncbi:MAG: MEDS domain-containing protein [Candidatus Omnitrophota bacterium]
MESIILNNHFKHKHMCLFYGSNKDLFELVVPYFREGLERNKLCIWAVPESLGLKEAQQALSEGIGGLKEYIDKGQLRLFEARSVYNRSGRFVRSEILDGWGKILEEALSLGFDGIRVSGDASFLPEEEKNELLLYEKEADAVIRESKVEALCTYPLDKTDLVEMFILSICHGSTFRNKNSKLEILTR